MTLKGLGELSLSRLIYLFTQCPYPQGLFDRFYFQGYIIIFPMDFSVLTMYPLEVPEAMQATYEQD